MRKLIYLSNGQQAELVNELPDGKYLVDPICSYQDYNSGEWFDLPSNGFQIVDNIFNSPPIEKISKEVSELLEQKKVLTTENSKIRQDNLSAKLALQQIESKVQDIKKWQIDLSKWKSCKTIHFFIVGELAPKSINKPKYTNDYYKLNWSICAGKTDELQFNLRVESSDYYAKDVVDEEYGYMFDISDDELRRIALERAQKMDLSSYDSPYKFNGLPDFLKIDRVVEKMKECEELNKKRAIESYNKQIADIQEKLRELS